MAEPTVRKSPDRELLLSNHTFPCRYTIKAFGPGDGFADELKKEVLEQLGDEGRVNFSERGTASGKSMCLTMDIEIEDVDELIALYEKIHEHPDLKMIL